MAGIILQLNNGKIWFILKRVEISRWYLRVEDPGLSVIDLLIEEVQESH